MREAMEVVAVPMRSEPLRDVDALGGRARPADRRRVGARWNRHAHHDDPSASARHSIRAGTWMTGARL